MQAMDDQHDIASQGKLSRQLRENMALEAEVENSPVRRKAGSSGHRSWKSTYNGDAWTPVSSGTDCSDAAEGSMPTLGKRDDAGADLEAVLAELNNLTDPRNWSLGTPYVGGKQGASEGGADPEAVIAHLRDITDPKRWLAWGAGEGASIGEEASSVMDQNERSTDDDEKHEPVFTRGGNPPRKKETLSSPSVGDLGITAGVEETKENWPPAEAEMNGETTPGANERGGSHSPPSGTLEDMISSEDVNESTAAIGSYSRHRCLLDRVKPLSFLMYIIITLFGC